jgi:hypothetical protein
VNAVLICSSGGTPVAAIIEPTVSSARPAQPRTIAMTPAMREGLDALQREYDAFVEESFKADLTERTT